MRIASCGDGLAGKDLQHRKQSLETLEEFESGGGSCPGRRQRAPGFIDWQQLWSCLSWIGRFPWGRRSLKSISPIRYRESASEGPLPAAFPASQSVAAAAWAMGPRSTRTTSGGTPSLRAAIGRPRGTLPVSRCWLLSLEDEDGSAPRNPRLAPLRAAAGRA